MHLDNIFFYFLFFMCVTVYAIMQADTLTVRLVTLGKGENVPGIICLLLHVCQACMHKMQI